MPQLLTVARRLIRELPELADPDAPLNGGDAVDALTRIWPQLVKAVQQETTRLKRERGRRLNADRCIRLAKKFNSTNWALFDHHKFQGDFEVEPMVYSNESGEGEDCERATDGETPSFWAVYGREAPTGHAVWLADFETKKEAQGFKEAIS